MSKFVDSGQVKERLENIAEKLSSFERPGSELDIDKQELLDQINSELRDAHGALAELYNEVAELYAQGASEEEYDHLIETIIAHKQQIREMSNRQHSTQNPWE